jgi:hypothetical protein
MAVIPEDPARPAASGAEPWNLVRLLTRPPTDSDPRWHGLWIGAVLCLGLLARLFWDSLANLPPLTIDENYSHGFLVPLISLYFANLVARRPGAVRGGTWLGVLLC